MAGIFPESGVNAGAAAANALQGLVEGVDYEAGCPPRFFGNSCRPAFDPAAGNAIISELLNVLRDRGIAYDCSTLDNLSKAIGPHLISYECRINLPTDPWPVKNGTDIVTQGSFTIPNTSGRDMQCLLISQLTTLIKTLSGGDSENIWVTMSLSNDNSYDGNLMYSAIRMRRSGNVDYDSWQSVKTGISNIPAGGRTYYYQIKTIASAGNAFQLKEDFAGSRFRAFGHSYTTSDILQEVR